MHAVFSKLQYEYQFVDMGDNFVVKLAVHVSVLQKAGGPAQFVMDLSKSISCDIRLYGHDIKPDESTCSLKTFIFCHHYLVSGVQYPCHLRKAANV